MPHKIRAPLESQLHSVAPPPPRNARCRALALPAAGEPGLPCAPPFGRARAACRGRQRAEAGATRAEGRGGAAHGAHQRRRHNHLRPLQLLRLQHAGGLERRVQLNLRPRLHAAMPSPNQSSLEAICTSSRCGRRRRWMWSGVGLAEHCRRPQGAQPRRRRQGAPPRRRRRQGAPLRHSPRRRRPQGEKGEEQRSALEMDLQDPSGVLQAQRDKQAATAWVRLATRSVG